MVVHFLQLIYTDLNQGDNCMTQPIKLNLFILIFMIISKVQACCSGHTPQLSRLSV